MLSVLIGLCCFLTTLFVINLNVNWKCHPNLPPSLTQFQFLFLLIRGCWYNGKSLHRIFQSMSKKYGPVTFTQVGALNIAFVQDYNHIKETLLHEDWVDRYFDDFVALRSSGKHAGVFMVGGEVWKKMREFCITCLRKYGVANTEDLRITLHEELHELIEITLNRVQTGCGIFEIERLFTIPVYNILERILAGRRTEHANSQRVHKIVDLIDSSVKEFAIGTPNVGIFHAAFPRLANLAAVFSNRVKGVEILKIREEIHGHLQEMLDERRAVGEYQFEPRNYVDAFLREIDQNIDGSGNHHFTDEQFFIVTTDLFITGSETSRNFLEFAILYMVLHPEVQAKVYAEILDVIGPSRYPLMADKLKMPYTSATLLEVHRRGSVGVYTVRSPIRDSKIGKYSVPKGTLGIFNLYEMHMDENTWTCPRDFNPERFLDSENNVVNSNKILPFGIGKRACFGETVANATIFTLFTGLIQRFTFEVSPEHPRPSWNKVLGVTLSPQPFHFLVKERISAESNIP